MNQTVTAAVLNFDCVTVVQCSDCAVLCVIAEWKSTGCLVCAGCVFSLTCSTSSLFITHCCTGEAEGQIFLLTFFLLSLFFVFFFGFIRQPVSLRQSFFLVFPALRWFLLFYFLFCFTFLFLDLPLPSCFLFYFLSFVFLTPIVSCLLGFWILWCFSLDSGFLISSLLNLAFSLWWPACLCLALVSLSPGL